MNKIIIDPHYCSKEEYQELKDYLSNKTWDWQEVSSGEEEPYQVPEGHYTVEVLHHTVEWWAKDFDDDTLPESDLEHVKALVEEGYNSGELNIGEEEHRGWWKLIK